MISERCWERWQRVAALIAVVALITWIGVAADPLATAREILIGGTESILTTAVLVAVALLVLRHRARRRSQV